MALIGLTLCGTGAAIAIHFLYDILIGPDPRRFLLWSNIRMDIAIVCFNSLVALGFARLCQHVGDDNVCNL